MLLSPIQTDLLSYWRSKHRVRVLPARRDIDPAEIPKVLPWIMLIDVGSGPPRYRLVGERVERAYGLRMSGRPVQDIVPINRLPFAQRTCAAVLDQGLPLLSTCAMHPPFGSRLTAKRLMLPLSENGQSVDTVLAVLEMPDLEDREKTPLGPGSAIEHFEYEMLDASDEAR